MGEKKEERKISVKKKMAVAKYFRVLLATLQKRAVRFFSLEMHVVPCCPCPAASRAFPACARSSPRGPLPVPHAASSHKGSGRDPGPRMSAAVPRGLGTRQPCGKQSASGARPRGLRSPATEAPRLLAGQAS